MDRCKKWNNFGNFRQNLSDIMSDSLPKIGITAFSSGIESRNTYMAGIPESVPLSM